MASVPADETGPLADGLKSLEGTEPCHRLQLVAVLLAIVAVLGLAVAIGVLLLPTGEGLGDLLDAPSADVMGQVKLADGTPVHDASVTHEATGRTSTTGVSGWYFLEGLPTGEVELTMEADGYKTVVTTVVLERGESVLDIVAVAGSGSEEVRGKALAEAGDPTTGRMVMVVGIGAASILTLLAAVSAWQHLRYPLVVVGALLGVLTWGWFAGSAFSIIALLLLLPLRREFRDHTEEGEVPWHEPLPPSLEVDDDTITPDTSGEDEAVEVNPHTPGGDGQRDTGGMAPGP